MLCPNCGKEVREGALFCASCGAKITAAAGQDPEAGNAPDVTAAGASATGNDAAWAQTEGTGDAGGKDGSAAGQAVPSSKPPVKLIAVAAVAAVAVIAVLVVVLTGGSKTTIPLNDYISVSFSGYDTVGSAELEIDYASFAEDYEDLELSKNGLKELLQLTFPDSSSEEIDEMVEESLAAIEAMGYSPASMLSDACFTLVSLDNDDNLSNGDTVSLVWSLDEATLEMINSLTNGTIEYEEVSYTVEGLEEPSAFDPFEDIEVSFSGTSPNGKASVTKTSDSGVMSSLSYSIDVQDGLALGDTITVTVTSGYSDSELAKNYGVVLSSTSKTYTVDGLSSYITAADQIPESDLARMQQEVLDDYTAHAATKWGEAWSISGLDYIGGYLLTRKSGEGNIFYMVYQANAEYFAEETYGFVNEIYTYYYYASYDNLILTDTGELNVDYLDFDTVSDRYYVFSDTYFLGFGTLDEVYKALVTAQADQYSCENTVSDQDFGYEPARLDNLAGVPSDAVEYNGHYYKIYLLEEGMSWEEAQAHCELRGGHLATITSQEEMAAVGSKAYASSSKDLWIGGYYDAADGQWKWITGEAMEYLGWNDGEVPDATDSAVYPYMMMKPGRWYNCDNGVRHNNNYPVGYVCEWDSADTE